MAAPWMFTHVAEPNINTGTTAVPTSPTSVDTAVLMLMLADFCNTTTSSIALLVTDTAGNKIIDVNLGGKSLLQYSPNFRKLTGLKWSAASAGIVGQMQAYK